MENIKIVDISEYVSILGYDAGFGDNQRDFDELRELIKNDEKWDYPVTELKHCIENNISVVLVRHWNGLGWDERLFEV